LKAEIEKKYCFKPVRPDVFAKKLLQWDQMFFAKKILLQTGETRCFCEKNIAANWRDQRFLRKKYLCKPVRPVVFCKKYCYSETRYFCEKYCLKAVRSATIAKKSPNPYCVKLNTQFVSAKTATYVLILLCNLKQGQVFKWQIGEITIVSSNPRTIHGTFSW
jgi:hypothetical protein